MKYFFKHILISLLLVLALISLYFSSYSIFVKSYRFDAALAALSSLKSIEEFQVRFDRVFSFYSPITEEEIIRLIATETRRLVSIGIRENAADRFVAYVEPRIFKNDIRHLMIMGKTYFMLWQEYGRDRDFEMTERYYREALAMAPRLPNLLYDLLNIYDIGKEQEKAAEIANRILVLWPDDKLVRELLERFNNK